MTHHSEHDEEEKNLPDENLDAEIDLESDEPAKYAVLLHNDDYTTMEFVLDVLSRFFQKSQEEAMQIMLKVHREGRGVAGVYSLEIAETKADQVVRLAKSRGFPLLCTIEQV